LAQKSQVNHYSAKYPAKRVPQFTKAEREERAAHYIGEAERWEHLAAHSARSTNSKDMQA